MTTRAGGWPSCVWRGLYAADVLPDLRQQKLRLAGHGHGPARFFWHAVLPQFEVITLAHLQGQASRYSQIRLWGSIGFIIAVVALGRLFEWLSLDICPVTLVVIMAGIIISSL